MFHKIAFYNYYFNRLNTYKYSHYKFFEILKYIQYILLKTSNIVNDDVCFFEREILGGIVESLFSGKFNFQQQYNDSFISRYKDCEHFKVIKAVRGEPHNHKFVLCADSADEAQRLISHLKDRKIYSLNGYRLLFHDREKLPNTSKINGCIVEIPIENNPRKMDYLFQTLDSLLLEW